MALFAISDLHLSLGVDKPMDIFGTRWENHIERIRANWLKSIKEEDIVVIPGDISWGINLEESRPDFEFLEGLPGIKILSKGNHDYWWSTVNKIEGYFKEHGFASLKLIKNNHFEVSQKVNLCGTRGWILPSDPLFEKSDRKIYNRELGRLENSLKSARAGSGEDKLIVAALHYPPLFSNQTETEFTELLEKYRVFHCVYGHIHDNFGKKCFEGELNGIKYSNISGDKIDFKPLCIRV